MEDRRSASVEDYSIAENSLVGRVEPMTVDRPDDYLISIIHELRKLPGETEWVEFKGNKNDPEEIGEYISALANSAALLGKVTAYMVWGIDNQTHDIIGTYSRPKLKKIGC